MRNISTEIRDLTKSQTKNIGFPLYCTVNGVLTPVLYSETDLDGNDYYKEVFLTNAKKIRARKSLSQASISTSPLTETVTTTTVKPQGTTTTTSQVEISPVVSFNYNFGIQETSGAVTLWNSAMGGYALTQGTTANQPLLGERGAGEPLSSSINFRFNDSASTNDYMTLNNSITLQGDFTMFFFFRMNAYAGAYKFLRLLGNSSDATTFVSASETINKGYKFSVGGSSVEQSKENFKPSNELTQLTVQRNGSTLIIREDGVEVVNDTIATTDFTFDQVGAVGGTYSSTINANIYHISVYNGYIQTDLERIESEITKLAAKATQ